MRNLIIISGIIFLLACVSRSQFNAETEPFIGEWESSNGGYLAVKSDGTGDYSISNKTIKGGKITLQKDTMDISVFGIHEKLYIDGGPFEENGTKVIFINNTKFYLMQ